SLVYDVDGAAALAHLTRAARSEQDAVVQLKPLGDGEERRGGGNECRVLPKALVPQCATRSSGGKRQGLTVRGGPGPPVRLQWGRPSGGWLLDGEYTDATRSLQFRPLVSGNFLVGVHDVPADRDAAPLSCQLVELSSGQPVRVVARDFLAVSPRKPFDRAFNY